MSMFLALVHLFVSTVGFLFIWLVWVGGMLDVAKMDDNMGEKTKFVFAFLFGFLPPPIVYGFAVYGWYCEVFK